ncbi:MAG: hypothetical protein COB02_11540 [Candidatus Cloacimonadota bacterium]|nr:MAG: hypothetical protein COB02_11540 [Candidatus Cloacimonadota bacterium]
MISTAKAQRLKITLLLLCMLLSGYCGIISELSLFNLGTVLIGGANKTLFYTMGIMMFFMGIGSFLTSLKMFKNVSMDHFAVVEILLSFFCMSSVSFIQILASEFPHHTLYFFLIYSPIIGILIGMEIPIILRINEKMGANLGENSSFVMMADYFGCLFAFLLFPFYLFPNYGIEISAFSGGIINLLLAISTLFVFPSDFKHKIAVRLFAFLTLTFSIWLGLSLKELSDISEQKLYRDPIIFKTNTPYQKLVVTNKVPFHDNLYNKKNKSQLKVIFQSDNKRFEVKRFLDRFNKDIRFFINGGLQFSTIDEYRYHEFIAHPALLLHPNIKNVLILGGGDGLVAREVLKHKNVESIILIDLDKELTDLFKYSDLSKLNNHSFQSQKVHIINDDAFLFLRQNNQKFDVILIDFPDPHSIHTAKLYTRQFFLLMKQSLSDDGHFCIQSASPLFNRKVFLSIGKTLRAAGLTATAQQINMKTFEVWGFHLGSKTKNEKEIKDSLKNININVQTKFLNNEILNASFSFGKDMYQGFNKIPVNDMNRLSLSNLYNEN